MAEDLAIGDKVTIDPAKLTGQSQRMLKNVSEFEVIALVEGRYPAVTVSYDGGRRTVLTEELLPAVVSVEKP